jgi:hypothetical protein
MPRYTARTHNLSLTFATSSETTWSEGRRRRAAVEFLRADDVAEAALTRQGRCAIGVKSSATAAAAEDRWESARAAVAIAVRRAAQHHSYN